MFADRLELRQALPRLADGEERCLLGVPGQERSEFYLVRGTGEVSKDWLVLFSNSKLLNGVEHTMTKQGWQIVFRRPEGTLLREVLREQRELTLERSFLCLRSLEDKLELAIAEKLCRLKLNSAALVWDGAGLGVLAPTVPARVEEVDPFVTRLGAVSRMEQVDVPSHTGEYVRDGVLLLFELLGSPMKEGDAFVPHPRLDAQQNAILRGVWERDLRFSSWHEWLTRLGAIRSAEPTVLQDSSLEETQPLSPATTYSLPETFASPSASDESLSSLQISVVEPQPRSYQICWGSELRLGRSGSSADFVAQFVPRTPAQDARSLKIGRCQLVMEYLGGARWKFQEEGSTNPSLIDGQVGEAIFENPRRVELTLAGEYRTEVSWHPWSAEGWPAELQGVLAKHDWVGSVSVQGLERDVLAWQAIWIFGGAPFGITQRRLLCVGDGFADTSGVLFCDQDFLWVATSPHGTGVWAETTLLRVGEAVPLHHCSRMKIGEQTFFVRTRE
ncbi:MAG: hypothetical protein ACFCU3_05825 [Verrucomicrobiales bacterium]